MPARKKAEPEAATEPEAEVKLVGEDKLPESPDDSSGNKEAPPREHPTRRRATARRKAETATAAAEAGGTPVQPVVLHPTTPVAKASKLAVETAGDFYALLGTAASVAQFPMAGATMQAQKDEAGKVLATWAMGNAPRVYSFLESAGKTTAILPLVICPVMAEMYMRTENPLVETMCAGILEQYLAGTTLEMPDPDAPDGKSKVDTWQMLTAFRGEVLKNRAVMQDMADRTAPVNPDDNGLSEDSENARKVANAIKGEGWVDG